MHDDSFYYLLWTVILPDITWDNTTQADLLPTEVPYEPILYTNLHIEHESSFADDSDHYSQRTAGCADSSGYLKDHHHGLLEFQDFYTAFIPHRH